ncbi:ATP-binding protein [Actinomadura sp. 7K507]|uniref:ATP-binding protein n=1 Tax=Actinomadura sp. 7K507 TaxID=2530365 RepID=UPI001045B81F|nr:ATP-binding protein [Actinomadura sp. 7K507]TDC81207.1 ATP-binding protein [Actinomadura sp. 7K507]
MGMGGGRAGRRPASRVEQRRRTVPAARPAEGAIRLPSEPESVSVGRRWLRGVLGREFGDGHPVIGDALQALSEVLSNAVLYGDGLHVRVTYTVDGEWVEVAVHNEGRPGGTRPQKQAPAAPDAESGRGLDLVEAFSQQWGIKMLPMDEVKVWFRVRFG